MQDIVKNTYYELAYDERRNWMYWTMRGFWKSMSVAPNFDTDWKAAIAVATRPFKVFSDLSTFKAPPPDVKSANEKMQQYAMQNGCEKVACLVDSPTTKLTMSLVIRGSGMEDMVQYFSGSESPLAEEWLTE